MWSITEQLIDMPRAVAIQRRMIAALRPPPRRVCATRRRRRRSPAARPRSSRPAGWRASARWRCAAPRARSARGRASTRGTARRLRRALLAIPEIGTWTVEMLALHGLGRLDVVPAGDLGYLKLVGRLTTGNPKAVADEAEVRGFFAPYAPWAGLAALAPHPRADCAQPLARQELVGQRRRLGGRPLEQAVRRASSARSWPSRPAPASPRASRCRPGRRPAASPSSTASCRPRSRPLSAFSSASTPAAGFVAQQPVAGGRRGEEAPQPRGARRRRAPRGGRRGSARRRSARRASPCAGSPARGLRRCEVDALVVPERAERRVDLLGEHRGRRG